MIYQVGLEKEQTYWWDEDKYGSCMFAAKNDAAAGAFIATVVNRINRTYKKLGEPRNVSVVSLFCLEESGYSFTRKKVDLSTYLEPLIGFRNIRRVLDAFYPKSGRHRDCIARVFTSFNPPTHPRH